MRAAKKITEAISSFDLIPINFALESAFVKPF